MKKIKILFTRETSLSFKKVDSDIAGQLHNAVSQKYVDKKGFTHYMFSTKLFFNYE